MPIEFGAAAYRFGHSMVRPSYRANFTSGTGDSTSPPAGPFFGLVFDATQPNFDTPPCCKGSFFVVSVFLQEVRHFDAIQTGLMLTPATLGVLATSAAADRLARRRAQRSLIIAGFVVTAAGMALLLALVRKDSGNVSFVPTALVGSVLWRRQSATRSRQRPPCCWSSRLSALASAC